MNTENITEQLKDIIRPYVKDQTSVDSINNETDFIKDLQINSANLVDIVLDIEEKFDVVIDNESMERMLTVQAALDIITSKLAER